MVDPVTANVQLNIPAHLSDSGSWDSSLNANFSAEDAMYGSVTSLSLSSSTTLSVAQQQVSILRLSGTLVGAVQITVGLAKGWIVENSCSGAFNVTITGGSGNVVALPPGSCQVYWDGANCNFVNLGQVGGYLDLATTVVPTWITGCTVPPYLYCGGGTFSAVTYPILNAILGGNTLPDFQGRLPAYMDGGAGRITTAGGGVSGVTFLAGGGAQNRALTQPNLPNINPISDPGHTHPYSGGAAVPIAYAAGGGIGSISASPGSGQTTGNSTTSITAFINGNVTQQNFTTLPPILMCGIRMIRAA